MLAERGIVEAGQAPCSLAGDYVRTCYQGKRRPGNPARGRLSIVGATGEGQLVVEAVGGMDAFRGQQEVAAILVIEAAGPEGRCAGLHLERARGVAIDR